MPSLFDGLEAIESLERDEIDHQNIEQVAEQLAKASQMLHITGRLVEIATRVYDYSKGLAAYKITTNEETKRLQPSIQAKIMEGMISEYSGIKARTERTVKNLGVYIDSLRTLVSKNKEQQRMENFNT